MKDGKFIKLKCNGCKNEQIVFNKASRDVTCLVCGKELLFCTGGKSVVKAKILQAF